MEMVQSLQNLAPAAILADVLIILVGAGLVWAFATTFALGRKGR